uniref:Uncharacterized protein n=1 Tax=Pristhesancus plagipennis TaxID=1955184 RepID=A0A2K8JPK4_PRIPG|nr:secreted hypothetical protein [Pristhesancus plagipennis]
MRVLVTIMFFLVFTLTLGHKERVHTDLHTWGHNLARLYHLAAAIGTNSYKP